MGIGLGGRTALLPIGVTAAAAAGVLLLRHGVAGLATAVAAGRTGGAAVLGDLVESAAAAGAGVLLLWLAFGAVVQTAVALRGRRGRPAGPLAALADRITPALTRRLVATALGAGVVCGTALPASALAVDPGWAPVPAVSAPADGLADSSAAAAAPTQTPGTTPAPTQSPSATQGATPGATPTPGATQPAGEAWQAPRPTAPVTGVDADLGPLEVAPREGAMADEAVVVRRGDTLWDIAASTLPSGASDAQIAVEWPRWYAANAAVIGANPDHIEPGMRLVPPGTPGSGS
jgi:resuscitation-promoting factor RpfA